MARRSAGLPTIVGAHKEGQLLAPHRASLRPDCAYLLPHELDVAVAAFGGSEALSQQVSWRALGRGEGMVSLCTHSLARSVPATSPILTSMVVALTASQGEPADDARRSAF